MKYRVVELPRPPDGDMLESVHPRGFTLVCITANVNASGPWGWATFARKL